MAQAQHRSLLDAAAKHEVEQRTSELFATHRILEIRNIANKTKAEAEDKKEELKRLIGHRYKDIIEAADAIGEMRSAVSSLSEQLQQMGRLCEALRPASMGLQDAKIPTIPGFPRPEEEIFQLYRYRLAVQVDCLIRTPDDIWLSLQRRDFIAAAKHYIVAQAVQKNLSNWTPSDQRLADLKQSFKIIDTQWTKIQTFPQQIAAEARQCLADVDPTLTEKNLANALVALAVVESRSPMQLFVEFIDRRKKSISLTLNAIRESRQPASATKVKETLLDAISKVQNSLYHLGCIFIRDRFELLDTALPAATALAASPAKTFGAKSPSQTHIPTVRYEALLISMRNQTFQDISNTIQSLLKIDPKKTSEEFLPPSATAPFVLSFDSVRNLATDWVKSLQKTFAPALADIIKFIQSGSDLTMLRNSLIEKIQLPFHQGTQDSGTNMLSLSGSISTPPSPSISSATGAPLSWRQIASIVLTEDIDLWTLLLHKTMLHHANHLIATAFTKVQLDTRVDATMKDLVEKLKKTDVDIEERNLGEYIWDASALSSTVTLSVSEFEALASRDRALGLTARAKVLISDFDSNLEATMQDLLFLIDEKHSHLPLTIKADCRELRSHIQKSCVDAVARFADALRTRLDTIRTLIMEQQQDSAAATTKSSTSAPTAQLFLGVEQALAIARLARFIKLKSQQLRSIIIGLDPFDTMNFSLLRTAAASASAGPAASPHTNALFQKATLLLDRVYVDGFLLWALNTSSYLDGLLHERLYAHLAITSDKEQQQPEDYALLVGARVRSCWQELKIASESSASLESEYFVPTQPSIYVISFLFAIIQEIQRVGAHAVDREIIEYLVHVLSERAMRIFDQFASTIQNEASNPPKEIAIQLYFDAKFLFDILSCRTVTSSLVRERVATFLHKKQEAQQEQAEDDEFDEVEEMFQWKKQLDAFVLRLKALIDPIDFAFYGPHLIRNSKACYQRMYILFGTLTQASALSDATGSGASSSSSASSATGQSQNQPAISLNMVNSNIRFSLLPTPTTSVSTTPVASASAAASSSIGGKRSPASPAESASGAAASRDRGAAKSKPAADSKSGIWDKFTGLRGSLFS